MDSHAARTGVLLVNLGTPDAPTPKAVRRYLAEFLSDPRVLDIPALARWMLLHCVILRTRPQQAARAYAKIFRPNGSPLLLESQAFTTALRTRLPDVPVELAMRYGNPSLTSGLAALRARGCDAVIVFPLYPQYASSSTGSTVEAVYRKVARVWNTPFLQVVPPFWQFAGFIDAFARVGRPVLDELSPEHVLLSFHGLPERHIRKSDDSRMHCFASTSCCDTIGEVNRNCYRAQCFATARLLASRLGLAPERWSVCFQSRLGRTPWIRPYTDEVIVELAKRGVARVAVFCPAFVADCLETLEEIELRAAEAFRAAGGQTLRLVPSLNADPGWVDAAAALLRRMLT